MNVVSSMWTLSQVCERCLKYVNVVSSMWTLSRIEWTLSHIEWTLSHIEWTLSHIEWTLSQINEHYCSKHLTKERLNTIFKKFDFDENGYITTDCLIHAVNQAGFSMTSGQAEDLIKKYDNYGNGYLDVENLFLYNIILFKTKDFKRMMTSS